MASKIMGINIKIGADTTGLDTTLKNIENSGKGARSELNEIKRAINQNKDSIVLWQQKQEVLTKAIENSKEKQIFYYRHKKALNRLSKMVILTVRLMTNSRKNCRNPLTN